MASYVGTAKFINSRLDICNQKAERVGGCSRGLELEVGEDEENKQQLASRLGRFVGVM